MLNNTQKLPFRIDNLYIQKLYFTKFIFCIERTVIAQRGALLRSLYAIKGIYKFGKTLVKGNFEMEFLNIHKYRQFFINFLYLNFEIYFFFSQKTVTELQELNFNNNSFTNCLK